MDRGVQQTNIRTVNTGKTKVGALPLADTLAKGRKIDHLCETAKHEGKEEKALKAVDAVPRKYEDHLIDIAIYADFESVALKAAKKIDKTNLAALSEISEKSVHKSVREYAKGTLESGRPDANMEAGIVDRATEEALGIDEKKAMAALRRIPNKGGHFRAYEEHFTKIAMFALPKIAWLAAMEIYSSAALYHVLDVLESRGEGNTEFAGFVRNKINGLDKTCRGSLPAEGAHLVA